MHFTLIASDLDEDLPPRWKPVPMNSVVTMTRGDAPKIESI
jgi:hypothetical protein